jgi:hypothetical protein
VVPELSYRHPGTYPAGVFKLDLGLEFEVLLEEVEVLEEVLFDR